MTVDFQTKMSDVHASTHSAANSFASSWVNICGHARSNLKVRECSTIPKGDRLQGCPHTSKPMGRIGAPRSERFLGLALLLAAKELSASAAALVPHHTNDETISGGARAGGRKVTYR